VERKSKIRTKTKRTRKRKRRKPRYNNGVKCKGEDGTEVI
jgi:hypothetical protein